MSIVDSFVVCGGAARLAETDFARAAAALACEIACIKAVTEIESRGGGFLASGRPKILFEAHIFSRATQRRYDESHPDISSPKWNRKLYLGGEREYERLERAIALDLEAALSSASWGLFQVMGFHHRKVGFESAAAYVQAMFQSEGRQLDVFVDFIKATRLDEHLRGKRWDKFAEGYNGPGYRENKYDQKLRAAHAKYSQRGG